MYIYIYICIYIHIYIYIYIYVIPWLAITHQRPRHLPQSKILPTRHHIATGTLMLLYNPNVIATLPYRDGIFIPTRHHIAMPTLERRLA